MTYLGAANHADDATFTARNAEAQAEDPYQRQLARAVSELAQAVAELSRTLHRESD
jgi:hypothetical protein